MVARASSLGCARRRADDVINADAHVFANLRLIVRAPAINELKSVNGLLNIFGKALDHFRIRAEQVRENMRDHYPHGEDFGSLSNATRHLSFSSMCGGAA